jgi:hypothetical protein
MGNRLKNISLLEPMAAVAFPPAYRPARKGSAQLNSWLSSADAHLLLRKQTRMAIAQKNYAHAIALLNRQKAPSTMPIAGSCTILWPK